jgi:CelD/BcsL family acetyltransferase involved in cellulose biosynthesis
VVAGVRERGPGEVGVARLRLVAEIGGQADPAVALAGVQHARRLALPEGVERLLERLPDQRRRGVRPRATRPRVELVELALRLVKDLADGEALAHLALVLSSRMKARVLSGRRASVSRSSGLPCAPLLSAVTSAPYASP